MLRLLVPKLVQKKSQYKPQLKMFLCTRAIPKGLLSIFKTIVNLSQVMIMKYEAMSVVILEYVFS